MPPHSPARHWPALGHYVGQLGTPLTHLEDRCSPMGQRATMGSDSETRDEVGRLPHGGGQPVATRAVFW